MKRAVRIATYNVHKCRGLDRRTNPDRIAGVISKLDADIVAVQEIVDAPNGRPEFDQVRRIRSKLTGYEICFGENRTLHGGRYGNLTLSRLPLTAWVALPALLLPTVRRARRGPEPA